MAYKKLFRFQLRLGTAESLEKHIQKLISQNSAIIDEVEPALQKKYHKITGISRQLSLDNSVTTGNLTRQSVRETLTTTLVSSKPQYSLVASRDHSSQVSIHQTLNFLNDDVNVLHSQPLNLAKTLRKTEEMVTVSIHPKNPERSIIKDLLLNSKQFGVVTEGEIESLYVCSTCKKGFQTADLLKYHTVCHCDGSQSPKTDSISPVPSPNSFVPTSNSKLENNGENGSITYSQKQPSKSLKQYPHKTKPEIMLMSGTENTSFTMEKPHINSNERKLLNEPLSSPGPMLGKTRLLDTKSSQLKKKQSAEKQFNLSLSELQKSPHNLKLYNYNKKDLDCNKTPSIKEKLQMFGGEVQIFDKNEEVKVARFNSGGTMCSVSPGPESIENDQSILIHTGLHSGGMAIQIEREKTEKLPMTQKLVLSIVPPLAYTQASQIQKKIDNFHNLYNPVTVPKNQIEVSDGQASVILYEGKLIPFVPGIPGPNSLIETVQMDSKSLDITNSFPYNSSAIVQMRKCQEIDIHANANQQKTKYLKLNVGENDRNQSLTEHTLSNNEIKLEHFENKDRTIIVNKTDSKKSEKLIRFLRPSTLPLKPGTFTPKRHHGITPTANTLPLISPETPRISKNCVQLYLNGHAYTFLGLKCSTKPYYCTVNKPQPSYVSTKDRLSMYSNWQIYPENIPHPLKIKPSKAMALYDSRQRNCTFSVAANIRDVTCKTVNSQSTLVSCIENMICKRTVTVNFNEPIPIGENIEEVYVRGRGRGKYICNECGIRCKKPSMLKKHVRTHTDVRPYTCIHCSFSFKTKGNLTKHMKSKTHYKKCVELGIPVEDYSEQDFDSANGLLGVNTEEIEDTDNDTDGEENDTESEGNYF